MWKLSVKQLTPENVEEFKRDNKGWRTVKPLFESPTNGWETVKEKIMKFFILRDVQKPTESQAKLSKILKSMQHLLLLQTMGVNLKEEIQEEEEFQETDCPTRCVCDSSKSVQCCRVTTVPKAIPADTRKLHLGHNNIKQLRVSDFGGLYSIEELALSSCGMEATEAHTFSTLTHLRTLELWKNKLRRVPSKLPSNVEVLQLGNNQIQALM
ncbi:nephrocan-like [Stegostoma tigrinum]|uniref:nephrocan-like n=1 Tax=Stegostoma tigrinum TaxID=3053191 RepID=UPI00202B4498|nr:nephrocan-like [Stegostoma tigrinum]